MVSASVDAHIFYFHPWRLPMFGEIETKNINISYKCLSENMSASFLKVFYTTL